MITWLTSTTLGQILSTFCISMVPIVELRGGLPYGISLGLSYPLSLVAVVLGNMFPVPFIIVYIRRIFAWLRRRSSWWDGFITKLEKKAHLKGHVVRKYSAIGLCILVAIPLPGTGAWTGALVAALLDIRLRKAVPVIFLGVCIAASMIMLVVLGVIYGTMSMTRLPFVRARYFAWPLLP